MLTMVMTTVMMEWTQISSVCWKHDQQQERQSSEASLITNKIKTKRNRNSESNKSTKHKKTKNNSNDKKAKKKKNKKKKGSASSASSLSVAAVAKVASSSSTISTVAQNTSNSSTSMVVKYVKSHISTNNTKKAIMKMRNSIGTPNPRTTTAAVTSRSTNGEFVATATKNGYSNNSISVNDDISIPFDEREPTTSLASLNNVVEANNNNRKDNKVSNPDGDLRNTSNRQGLSISDGREEEEENEDYDVDIDDDVLLTRYLEDVCRRRCGSGGRNRKDAFSSKFHGDAEYIKSQPKNKPPAYQVLHRRTVIADENSGNKKSISNIDDNGNTKDRDDIYPPHEIVVTTTTTLPMSIPTLDEIPIQVFVPVDPDMASDISIDEFCFIVDDDDDGDDYNKLDEYDEDEAHAEEEYDDDGGDHGHHCNHNKSTSNDNVKSHRSLVDNLDCLYYNDTLKYLEEGKDDEDWPSDEEDCISNAIGDQLFDAYDGFKALVTDSSRNSTTEDFPMKRKCEEEKD